MVHMNVSIAKLRQPRVVTSLRAGWQGNAAGACPGPHRV